MEAISKKDAKAAGLNLYFTGKACRRGHVCSRYVKSGSCVECVPINRKTWRKNNHGRTLELQREWRRLNPEKEKEGHTKSNRKWWNAVKDRENAKKRDARKENPEKYREQRMKSYRKIVAIDPERILAPQRKWREKNRERWREITRKANIKFHERNPLFARMKAQSRRKAVRNNGGSHTVDDICDILKQQRERCAYCRIKISKKYHIGHIIPISKGGTNDRKNLQLLCEPCNLSKWKHDPIDFSRQKGMLL